MEERIDEARGLIRQVVETVAPGVVRIGQHGGRGCGFVYADGVVVTNAHNLRDRTTEVTFADGRAVQARAVGIDVDGDLAVLEVETGDAAPLAWLDTGVELGDRLFAVVRTSDGIRVTSGAVSGLGRRFRGPRGRRIADGIEHTAPLARGSSGSPIVDGSGRLVGITTLRLGDGFFVALPADAELRQRIEELRAGRTPQRRVLGVGLAPAHISRRLRRAVGLPDRVGVLVRMVEDGSPADRAGLRTGDLITAAGTGQGNQRDVDEVTSPEEVATALDRVPEAGSLRLHVVRGTDELDIAVPFDGAADEAAGEA